MADIHETQRFCWLVQREEIAISVARMNKSLPPKLLRAPVNHKEYEVRKAVAGSNYLSEADSKKLAGDKDYEVRRALAKNKKCPPDVLRKLAGDDDSDVAKAASRNLELPDAAVSDGVLLDEYSVRQATAWRKDRAEATGYQSKRHGRRRRVDRAFVFGDAARRPNKKNIYK